MKKILLSALCIVAIMQSQLVTFAVWVVKLTPQERKVQIQMLAAKRIAEQKAKKEAALKPRFNNGTFIVGKDIQPGTYRTRVANKWCYYVRVSGFGGTSDEIIANEFTNAISIVTISPTDKGFISKNCWTWTQDLTQITKNTTSFSDWIFIIWTDIAQGTYKNSGWKWCYYVRLANFSWDMDSIIANEFTNDVSMISIAPSDKGFKSNNCGTWNKVD